MEIPVVKTAAVPLRRVFARAVFAPAVLGLAVAAILAGCSHKRAESKTAGAKPAETAAPAASGGFVTGGALGSGDSGGKFVSPAAAGTPKFAAPQPTGKGALALASVPGKAPTPPSTRQDREKVTEGLIADRDRARYTDQGGRTMPVVVRPLNEAQAAPDQESAAPPKPQVAQAGAVTRLGEQPAPGKPSSKTENAAKGDEAAKAATVAEAARMAATAKAPPPPAEMAAGPRPSAVPAARNDGFRPLGTYEATTSVSNQVASVDFSGTGTSITAAGRRALSEAAKLGERSKGAFRVIARTTEATNLVQERATAVARELQRLGVAQDRIFVGTDVGQEGRVDVILDQ
jgi:outer membrane protein OmpA-like peptidoglycan-associated protein